LMSIVSLVIAPHIAENRSHTSDDKPNEVRLEASAPDVFEQH